MSSWEGRQTLVTGGGGFIGGHLAVALNRAGASVRAMCRYNSRADRGTLDWFGAASTAGIEVILGDVRDPESVERAVRGSEIVFNLAAQVAIPYSFVNPRDFVETNVGGALNVAQAALRTGVERVLHVSTSEVYGDARRWPITESHPLAPRSPYAASKVGADALMDSFHLSMGLPVTIARPFNTFGPHQSARAIIPTIASQALAGRRVRLGLLEPRRDLTFVSDTVAGLLAAAGHADAEGTTLQIGSGTDVSIGELAELIGEILGFRLDIELDPERIRPRSSEVPRLLCDHTRLSALTGWEPSVEMRTGLERTLEWIAANQRRYRTGEYAR